MTGKWELFLYLLGPKSQLDYSPWSLDFHIHALGPQLPPKGSQLTLAGCVWLLYPWIPAPNYRVGLKPQQPQRDQRIQQAKDYS